MQNKPHATKDSTATKAARSWRTALPRSWRESSTLRGLLVVAIGGGLYLGAFVGMFLLPLWWMRLACVILAPIAIGMLFVIGHDAAHNSLTPIGWLNRILGRLVMLPAYHPYTSWCHSHNTLHHGWTNFKGRHPDFSPFTKAEFDLLPWWRRLVERFYRTPIGIGPFYTFDFYFKHLIFPRGEHRSPFTLWFHIDRLIVLAFLVAQLSAAYFLTSFTPDMILPRSFFAFAAVMTTWTSWIWFMGFVSFVQHTHERMAWYNDEAEWSFYHVQLKSSAHVRFPWPIERLLNNIMDHPAHHLDPVIPLYNLPGSQKLLEEVAESHSVVYLWTPWGFWKTCAACKLYDFEKHCWTDFNGHPTTPCNLPDIPRPQSHQESSNGGRPEGLAGEVPAA